MGGHVRNFQSLPNSLPSSRSCSNTSKTTHSIRYIVTQPITYSTEEKNKINETSSIPSRASPLTASPDT